MKRLQTLAILCLTIFLVTIATGTLAQRPKQPLPDFFPLSLGAYWKYQTKTATGATSEFVVKVVAAENQPDGTSLYKTEVQSSQPLQTWYSKAPGWLLEQRQRYPKTEMEAVFAPTKQFLKNPLVQGDSWQWQGKGMMGIDISESSQVAGTETVTVPAGTFKAIKVLTDIVQGGTPVQKTAWYVDRVGLVKSVIISTPATGLSNQRFQTTSELVDFRLKWRSL